MAEPVSKASMDETFEFRIRDLKHHAALAAAAGVQGGQTPWMRPEGWTTSVFDFEALGKPFSREGANQGYLAAVRDPEKPGVVGDVVATTTMLEVLASLQQSFMVRQTYRRPRATAHMLGRKRGHGSDMGPLSVNYLEYVRAVLAQAKLT
jgi:hypothetical protein